MRRTPVRVSTVAMAVVLLAGACSPTPSATSSTLPTAAPSPTTVAPSSSAGPGGLSWTPAGLAETASLTVPLDEANPSAGMITLALARRRAADPAHRIGVLLLNPGGPGAPAAWMPGWDGLNTSIPQAVLDRFDVVAWDPRGVGSSRGLACPDAATVTRFESLDPSPTTPQALANYRSVFDSVAAQCTAQDGALLPYLSEASTARDMDAIRAALGEATISYLGWSYGTYLGYLYATMFPGHLRAAVLDGPVDPTLDLVGRDIGQARGFEAAFDHFLDLCARSKACAFHGGAQPGTIAKAYDALIARLERAPLGSTLNAGEAVTGVVSWLYSRDDAGLAEALAQAEQGNGEPLRHAADALFQSITLGSYEATVCLDVDHMTDATIGGAPVLARQASSRFGPFILLQDQYGCLDWPVAARPSPVAGPPPGLPPILVVAGTWDPATPSWDAVPMARALGTGVVLTRDGIGHTSGSSATTNDCLRSALVSYLDDLRPPAAGTVCTDPPPTFAR